MNYTGAKNKGNNPRSMTKLKKNVLLSIKVQANQRYFSYHKRNDWLIGPMKKHVIIQTTLQNYIENLL